MAKRNPKSKHAPVEDCDTALYRWRDKDRVLIYAGITNDLLRRQSQHTIGSVWTRFAASANIEVFPTRSAALAAEKHAIETEHPVFNIQYNVTDSAFLRLLWYLDEHEAMEIFNVWWPKNGMYVDDLQAEMDWAFRGLRNMYPELGDETSARVDNDEVFVRLRFRKPSPYAITGWGSHMELFRWGGYLWLYGPPFEGDDLLAESPLLLVHGEDFRELADNLVTTIRREVMPGLPNFYAKAIRGHQLRSAGTDLGRALARMYGVTLNYPQEIRCGGMYSAAVNRGKDPARVLSEMMEVAFGGKTYPCICRMPHPNYPDGLPMRSPDSRFCASCTGRRFAKIEDRKPLRAVPA